MYHLSARASALKLVSTAHPECGLHLDHLQMLCSGTKQRSEDRETLGMGNKMSRQMRPPKVSLSPNWGGLCGEPKGPFTPWTLDLGPGLHHPVACSLSCPRPQGGEGHQRGYLLIILALQFTGVIMEHGFDSRRTFLLLHVNIIFLQVARTASTLQELSGPWTIFFLLLPAGLGCPVLAVLCPTGP